MSDNSVENEFLNDQRIRHNLDVRRTGIKYWTSHQQQGWNQFCIDEEVTERIKTNSFHLEWPIDTTADGIAPEVNSSSGIDRTTQLFGESSVAFDAPSSNDRLTSQMSNDDPISNRPIDNYTVSDYPISNYPISSQPLADRPVDERSINNL